MVQFPPEAASVTVVDEDEDVVTGVDLEEEDSEDVVEVEVVEVGGAVKVNEADDVELDETETGGAVDEVEGVAEVLDWDGPDWR